MQYVLMFHDGFSSNPYPEQPETVPGGTAPVVVSLKAAEKKFREWLRDSGNDYTRASGYDAPWCDIYDVSQYDGVTCGEPLYRLQTCGRRGGMVRSSF